MCAAYARLQVNVDSQAVVREPDVRHVRRLLLPRRQQGVGSVVLDVAPQPHEQGPPRLELARQDDTVFDAEEKNGRYNM